MPPMGHAHRSPRRPQARRRGRPPLPSGAAPPADHHPPGADAGLITALRPVRGRPDAVAVRVGRARTAIVPASEVAALGLRVGAPWTADLAERCRAAQERLDAFTAAARILARRPRSTADLADRLRRRGCSADAIAHAVERLTERSLLNDARLARALIAAELERRPVGRARLAVRLARAGIPPAIARDALREALEGDDPAARALRAAQRRLARAARARSAADARATDPRAALRRLAAHLARLGFDADTALGAARAALNLRPDDPAPDDEPLHPDDTPTPAPRD
jgi:regulatory protein